MAVKDTIRKGVAVFRRRSKQIDLEEFILRQRARGFDGAKQVVDGTPMAPPIGYKPTPSMVDIVRQMVRSERLAQAAREAGHETFEESEDFDVGDEPEDLRSGFENDFDPPLEELLKAGREALATRQLNSAASSASAPPSDGPDPSHTPVPETDGPVEAPATARTPRRGK